MAKKIYRLVNIETDEENRREKMSPAYRATRNNSLVKHGRDWRWLEVRDESK